MLDNLRVAACETAVAEFDDCLGSFGILHESFALTGGEDIGEHFETHLVEIVHCFVLRV